MRPFLLVLVLRFKAPALTLIITLLHMIPNDPTPIFSVPTSARNHHASFHLTQLRSPYLFRIASQRLALLSPHKLDETSTC
ncbi:hypothetical protein BKA59DRAFT_472911 [Fusarium tricinctum]|uniref:Uncharacterized protein n=1 Tax=Fusarium tricinctum TaxID=61284 RepID=A0A8K0S3R3_9HYPO|nr:hypothetical protein BKA59DRAFT_472911 [Fusarium tricinctum]